MKRVLIPIDGSETALRAVECAVALAPVMREPLEVLLLNVQHPAPMRELLLDGRPSDVRALEKPQIEVGEELLKPAQALLRKSNIAHSGHVEIGDPAQTINAFAKKHHCEEIIMGTRGLGAAAGLILGSVANKVLHLASLPVMLVK